MLGGDTEGCTVERLFYGHSFVRFVLLGLLDGFFQACAVNGHSFDCFVLQGVLGEDTQSCTVETFFCGDSFGSHLPLEEGGEI